MGNNISSRTKGTQPNLSPIQRQLIEVLLSSVDPCLKDALWAVLKNTDGREAIQYLASLLANQNQNQNQNQPLTPEDHKRMQRNKAKALAIRTENLKRRHFVQYVEQNRRLIQESTSSSTNANTPPPPPAVNSGAGGQYALGFTPQPSPSQHVQNLKDPPEKKAMKQTTIPATRPFAVTPTNLNLFGRQTVESNVGRRDREGQGMKQVECQQFIHQAGTFFISDYFSKIKREQPHFKT